MKVTNWIGAAVALFFLFGALTSGFIYPPPPATPTHSSRPLEPAERNTLAQAMVNLAVPPPDTLPVVDENGDTHMVSCHEAGLDLLEQLADGHIEAETIKKGENSVLPDSSKSPQVDQMNVDPRLIAWAGAPVATEAWMRQLEAALLHEWYHKTQDTASLRNNDDREEVAPYNLMAAYYCSTATPPGPPEDDPFGKNAKKWAEHSKPRPPGQQGHLIRPIFPVRVDRHFMWLKRDTVAVGGSDSLQSLSPDDDVLHNFAFSPFRASDLMLVEDPPFLPPDHELAVVYGGFPMSGMARILLLDVFDGQVIAPVWSHDFGPPGYSPMFFYTAMQSPADGQWYVLDSLNHQILLMSDAMFSDGVPDEITGVFASAFWPGMEPLMSARGLEPAAHQFFGAGVLVLEEDAHFHCTFYPHDMNHFLVDTDGNLQADLLFALPLYQFLAFTPVIREPEPWPGDMLFTLFASWEHDIEIWSTDSTGEIMYEQLGLMHMAPGIDAECLLSRPLLAGEYIMPMDMQTGKRPRPILVQAPVPEHLVISVGPGGGILFLHWDPVPGAIEYAIWASEDGMDFFDTGMRTPVSQFVMPLPLPVPKQFFRVTAIR